jgi:cystathionine beta-lyase/cystathionine gamma-synthase
MTYELESVRTQGMDLTVVTDSIAVTTIIPLSEVKAHINVDFSDSDAKITELLKSAFREVELFIQKALKTKTVRQSYVEINGTIELAFSPIQSIISVTDSDLVAFTDYTTSFDNTKISAYSASGIVITYTAGFTSLPADIKNEILDIKAIADVAHSVGVPLIVDNTVATPYLIKPIDFGADVVVHSATKFLSGHGNAVVGAIIDAGKFDYAQHQDRFPGFNKPDPSYHGLVFSQALGVGSAFGANLSYIFKIRLQLLRDIGAAVSPFNAWLLAQGLETLSLRMDRHIENAKAVATWLEAHPDVEKVNYAALKSSPWNALAAKYAPKGPGAVLSFELKGGVEAGKKFVESLKLFSHVANIGDVRSLVIHPATTTHSQLSPAEQLEAGVTPGLVRLSLGLENIQDIKADLEDGFTAARG